MENTDLKTDITSEPTTQNLDSIQQLLRSLSLSSITLENQNQILQNTIVSVSKYFHSDHGYILLKSNESENPDQLKISAGFCDNSQADSLETVSIAIAESVVKKEQNSLLADAMNNNEFPGDPNLQRFNIKQVLCVALKTSGPALGVIYLDSSDESHKWNQEDLQQLESIAGYVALAVKVTQMNHQRKIDQRLITAGEVTLNISHSIKNIIQLFTGAAEVIDFGLRTNEIHRVKRSWDVLKPNLERLRKFTLDMLDFSKERALELGPCEFNRVVQSAIESLKSQLKQKETNLQINVDPQMPVIELDSERIHEMATNLILNAIDIVDEKSGVVSVETKYVPGETAVQLSVTDNGPGISEEAKEKIFLPFKSSKNKLGTGLGLAIAKKIAEQHKSRIEIESEPGKGTTFKVILPAKVLDKS